MRRHILECLDTLAASVRIAERHFNRQPGLARGIEAVKDLQQAGGGVFALQMLARKAGLPCEEIDQACAALREKIDQSLGRVMLRLVAENGHHKPGNGAEVGS